MDYILLPVPSMSSPSSPINHFLLGKNAILSTRDRRRRIGLGMVGPVPPARVAKLSMKASQGETLLWKDTDSKRRNFERRDSIKWKDIPKIDTPNTNNNDIHSKNVYDDNKLAPGGSDNFNSFVQDLRGDSDSSSSYSEESNTSSTSTELCDEPNRLSDFDVEPSSIDDTKDNSIAEAASPAHVAPICKQITESTNREESDDLPASSYSYLHDAVVEELDKKSELVDDLSKPNISSLSENFTVNSYSYPCDLNEDELSKVATSPIYEPLTAKQLFYQPDLSEEDMNKDVDKTSPIIEETLNKISSIYELNKQFTIPKTLSIESLNKELETRLTTISPIYESKDKFAGIRDISTESFEQASEINLPIESDPVYKTLSETLVSKISPPCDDSVVDSSYEDYFKKSFIYSHHISDENLSNKIEAVVSPTFELSTSFSRDRSDEKLNECCKNYVTEAAIENIAQTIQENKNLLSRVTEDRLKEAGSSKCQFAETNAVIKPETELKDDDLIQTTLSLDYLQEENNSTLNDLKTLDISSDYMEQPDYTYFITRRRLRESASEQDLQYCVLCQEPACTCSENTSQSTGKRHSERALQIIEENSKILHSITRYSITNTNELDFSQLPDFYSIKYGNNQTSLDSSNSGDATQNTVCISRSNSKYGLNLSKFITTTEPRLTFKNYFIDKEKLSPIYRLNSEEKNIFNIPSSANINDVVSDVTFEKECSSDTLTFDYKFHVVEEDTASTDEKDKSIKSDTITQSNTTTFDKSRLSLSSDFDFVLTKDLPSRLSPITPTSISSEYRGNIRNPYSSVLSPSHFSNFRSILSMDNNFSSDKFKPTIHSPDKNE